MKAAGVWCALVVAACAVDEDLHAPSIEGTPVVEEPSSIARIAGDTRTPWASGASGTLYVDQAWHYAMGYHFTPKVAGFVTHLGGFFRGAKTVKLFDTASGAVLAEATVSSTNMWSYVPISWLHVSAGKQYTIAAYIAGSGGSARYPSSAGSGSGSAGSGSAAPMFPRDFGDVRIDGSTYAYTGTNATVRPTLVYPYAMYGQVDIGFRRASTATPDLQGIVRSPYGAPPSYSGFGTSLAVSRGQIVAVSQGETAPSGTMGLVHIVDPWTGAITKTLEQPAGYTPGFGYAPVVAANDHYVAVGDPDDKCGDLNRCGAVFVWDVASGALRYTLRPPVIASYNAFGEAVAIVGDRLAVSSGAIGSVRLYDLATGDLVRVIDNPDPASGPGGSYYDLFGDGLATDGTRLVIAAKYDEAAANVGDSGVVYVFDPTTGAQRLRIPNPNPVAYDYFGTSIAIAGNRIAVGCPNCDAGGIHDAGAVYIFDATTGAQLARFENPTPVEYAHFGNAVAAIGPQFIASQGLSSYAPMPFQSHMMSADGAYLTSIGDPEPQLKGYFGYAFAMIDDRLVIGRAMVGTFGWAGPDDSSLYFFD